MGYDTTQTGHLTRRALLRRAMQTGAYAATATLPPFLGRVAGVGATGTPTPAWSQVFGSRYTYADGFAYMVAKDGQIVEGGAVGFARSSHETQHPSTPWATTTRMNLASVSKTIAAVAIMSLVQSGHIVLTDHFYPYVQATILTKGAGVGTVRIQDLLTMTSALVGDGTLYLNVGTTVHDFLNTYLQQPLAAGATPGVTYLYSNTNFTILEYIIDLIVPTLTPIAYTGYTDYVNRAILAPMGVNTTAFSPTPDASTTATLCYTNAQDTRTGKFWPEMQCVGPGGWIAPVMEVIKYLIGIRNNTVLTSSTANTMFTQSLGWYPWNGVFGTYYHHNGGLVNGATPAQGLNTGVMRFTNGYDAVLLVNSPDDNIIPHMVDAFEAQLLLPRPVVQPGTALPSVHPNPVPQPIPGPQPIHGVTPNSLPTPR